MACFIVPAVTAAVTTVVSMGLKSSEKKHNAVNQDLHETEKKHDQSMDLKVKAHGIPFSEKLGWLSKLLWGGSALLAFEHVWHGEVVPWAPFLTAAGNPDSFSEMLHEMSTVGVGMAGMVTLAWCGMLVASHVIEKKKEGSAENGEV